MSKETNQKDDDKRLRSEEELARLAEECMASGDKTKALAGRLAKRAIHAKAKTGWTDIGAALRAGAMMEEFADLISLDPRPAKWLLQAICREFRRAGKEYSIELGRHVPDEAEIAELCEEFAAAGFNVTPEAIAHNVSAWKADMKSGYRGKDFFLFTPCGCNDLSLRAKPLQDGADWQTTYMA